MTNWMVRTQSDSLIQPLKCTTDKSPSIQLRTYNWEVWCISQKFFSKAYNSFLQRFWIGIHMEKYEHAK
jgi:hypothetical protein